MREAFEGKLSRIHWRCRCNLLLEHAGRVFALAGVLGVVAVLIERLLAVNVINAWTTGAVLVAAVVLAMVLWLMQQPSRMQTALLLDQRLGLQERFSTTLAMAGSDDPFAQVACREAREMAENIAPEESFPIRLPSFWRYTAGTWLLVVLLFLVLPQKDLLGFMAQKQQQEEQTRQIELAQQEIVQTTRSVEMMLKQLGNAELDAEFAQMDEFAHAAQPDAAKRQAIRKLGDIGDKLKQMQSNPQFGSVEALQKMLKQLRGAPGALAPEMQRALARGDYNKASQLMKQLQQQMLQGEMTEQQRQGLTKQLQDLAQQLKQLAEKNEQFADELEKLGLDRKLAKLNEEQLRQALQKQGLDPEKIEQLMQKMAACRSACSRCSKLGAAMAACGAGQLAADELLAAIDQLDELDALKQQAMLSQATLDELARAAACLGKGMCQGPGCQGPFREGLAQNSKPGSGGPGRGYGPRDSDEEGQTSNKQTRVQNEPGQGPIIASWYFKGPQVRGEATREFTEVVQAGRDSAAEAINDNEIPRKYEQAVKQYFGRLEASGEQ